LRKQTWVDTPTGGGGNSQALMEEKKWRGESPRCALSSGEEGISSVVVGLNLNQVNEAVIQGTRWTGPKGEEEKKKKSALFRVGRSWGWEVREKGHLAIRGLSGAPFRGHLRHGKTSFSGPDGPGERGG